MATPVHAFIFALSLSLLVVGHPEGWSARVFSFRGACNVPDGGRPFHLGLPQNGREDGASLTEVLSREEYFSP
jgi:hypothetical protein